MGVLERGRNFRLVILGEQGTGKTALTVRFLTGRFIGEYASGMDVAYSHIVTINSEQLTIQMLDTSATKYSKAALAWADGVIVVYSIVDRRSLRKATEVLEEVRQTNNRNVVTAIIATKAELWSHRTVLKFEGEHLAKQYNASYFEVSAAQDFKPIKRVFLILARKMLEVRVKTEKQMGNKTPIVFRKLLHKYEKRPPTI